MCSKTEFYINKAILKHGLKYDYSLLNNINKRIDIVTIICPDHGEFTQSLHKHICGDGCKKCGSILTGSKKIEKAKNEFIEKADKIHNNFYDYSKVQYKNAITKVTIICKKHGEFELTPNAHLNSYKCKICVKENHNLLIPWETQLKEFIKIHENKYDYSKVIYNKGVESKIIVICPEHGEFIIRAHDHKKRGCKKCSFILTTNKIIEKSKNDFLSRSYDIWKETFDYSKVEYKNSKDKVTIICKKHGDFKIRPTNFLRGQGCKKCGIENNKRNELLKKQCSESFVTRANKIHNNKYNYEKSIYITSTIKLTVNCPEHGDFEISPNCHLSGQGCAKCGRLIISKSSIISLEEYLPKMINLWGNKYDYSNIDWKGSSFYIKLTCKKHGDFNIFPYNHIKGKECQKCFNQSSKISIQWLNYLQVKYNIFIRNADNIGEYVIPKTRLKADGYCKENNTIYEFLGDFWHGNPKIYDLLEINKRNNKTFLELFEKTNNRRQELIELGYNYLEIWENDWKNFIKIVIKIQKIWKSYH